MEGEGCTSLQSWSLHYGKLAVYLWRELHYGGGGVYLNAKLVPSLWEISCLPMEGASLWRGRGVPQCQVGPFTMGN